MKKPTLTVTIPDYVIGHKPDYIAIGEKIDKIIKDHFSRKSIAIRCLSLQDHPGMTTDELIGIISKSGTDRYDPQRKLSVAHDFYAEKGVELFASPYDNKAETISEIIEDMYESALGDRGYSIKVDLMVVYDQAQLDIIPIKYDDGGVGTGDFKFKDPKHKQNAVVGFIKIV